MNVRRPSPSLLISLLALFAALGGAAYATSGSIGSKQIKNGAVTTKKLKNGAVTTKKLKNNAVTAKKIRQNAVTEIKLRNGAVGTAELADRAVTGAKVDESTLGRVPSVQGFERLADRVVQPSASAPTFSAAQAAASRIPLFGSGPLTVYAKCFKYGADVAGYVYVETTGSEAIISPSSVQLITPSTPEDDRSPLGTSASPNSLGTIPHGDTEFWATHANGFIAATIPIAIKNGSPAAGNGFFGAGDRCYFGGGYREG